MITRKPVIAFVISENKKEDDSIFLWVVPISINWEGFLNDPDSENKIEKIIGVVPAPSETYKVYGSAEEGDELHELGYEFKGCHHPDWEEALKMSLY
jgi:hypothetical protein